MAGLVVGGGLLFGGCPDDLSQSLGGRPAAGVRKPRSFAARAPRETRLLAWLDLRRVEALARRGGPLARLGRRWRACGGGEVASASRLDLAVGGAGQVRVEVQGRVRLAPLRCLLGELHLPTGVWVGAGPNGRLRAALPGAMADGPGAPGWLRALLARSPEGAAGALATRLGSGSRAIDVVAWVNQAGVEVRLRFARRGWLRNAHRSLRRLVRRLDPRGDRGVVRIVDGQLRLRIRRLGELAPLLREGVVTTFRVTDEGMVPTLHAGEVAELRRGPLLPALERGDVVVVSRGKARLARRVVALGGDRVALREGRLWVNGRPVPAMRVDTGYRWDEAIEGGWQPRRAERWRENLAGSVYHTVQQGPVTFAAGEVRVPAGHLFVLADNRTLDRDSRQFGPVSRERVLGRLARIWWSTGPAGLRWERVAEQVR